MKIQFNAPAIFTSDIERSKKFYMDYLQQKILHDFGNNIMFKSHLSLWELKPEYEIKAIEGSSTNGNTFELYFETDDIAASFKSLKKVGVEFLHELKTEPWGQQTFRFFDPDRHLVEVGETIPTFVRRIYAETESVEATVERTGVPRETVEEMLG